MPALYASPQSETQDGLKLELYEVVVSLLSHTTGDQMLLVLCPSPITTDVIFCACLRTVSKVFRSWAGAPINGSMEMLVSCLMGDHFMTQVSTKG